MPSVQELIETMKGNPSSNNWDLVCSYSVDKLNDFLKNNYQAGKLARDLSFTTDYHEFMSQKDYDLSVDMTFGSPFLQFLEGQRAKCSLSMPIEKLFCTFTQKESKEQEIKRSITGRNYTLVGEFPLATIAGDTKEITESDSVVEFKDTEEKEQHIYIHFKGSKSENPYKIVPTPQPEDVDILNIAIIKISEYFNSEAVQEIEYALTSVTNKKASQEEQILPKSFIFATTQQGDVGVLSIYIQTVNSDNDRGNPNPSFQPGDKQILPIPQGYTASLIISNDFMGKNYFTKSFSQKGWKVERVSTEKSGIKYKLTKDKKISVSGLKTSGQNQVFSDDIVIDFNTHSFEFTLDNSVAQVNFNFCQKVKWKSNFVNISTGDSIHQEGAFDLNVKINKQLSNSISISESDVIQFTGTVESSDVEVSTENVKGANWGSDLENVENDVKQKIVPAIGSFDFGLPGINVFVVSNLLFSGQNVFKFDKKDGIHTPKDLILFGNI